MHLATYLGMMHRSELDLANGFLVVADGHAEEPDVYHTCQTLAKQCEEHAEKLEPFVGRYGEEKPEEPDRLYHELFDDVRQGSLGLLRDLQDLYVMAHFCDITWTMIGQAAQGARDRELLEAVEACAGQTATQIKWLETRMKQAAPQVLLVAS
jgi:hypothetical protein